MSEQVGVCDEGRQAVVLAVVAGEEGGVLLEAKFSCWRWLATTSSLTNLLGEDTLHKKREQCILNSNLSPKINNR